MCLILLVNLKNILYLPMPCMRALQLSILCAFGVLSLVLGLAQDGPAVLSEVRVFSDRIANQASAGAFAMPVSALRFEPQVDVQTRNLGEEQADLTIRGGTFESVGVKLGGISLAIHKQVTTWLKSQSPSRCWPPRKLLRARPSPWTGPMRPQVLSLTLGDPLPQEGWRI